MSSSTQRPILFFYWNCAILATVVNSQLLEMVLSPKSRLMSSPTGTQVTEAKLVSGGRGEAQVGCVCVCKRASPLEQSSGLWSIIWPLEATSVSPDPLPHIMLKKRSRK